MATSRIGGTKGKLKGQVGSVIYQVKKNPDGTYTQYVYNKGERTEETITPKLQAQRMCVAIVESLMADLKPVGRISFQSGSNKSQSLNGFSSNNIRLVQRDCKDHWYSDNQFVFPRRYNSEKDIQDLGGPFIISSGTLSYDTFDQLLWDYVPEIRFRNIPQSAGWLYGLLFQCRFGVETVDEFLDSHHMTRSDKVVFCGFREWLDYTQDPDDPQAYSKHDYIIVSINMRLSGSTLMTPEVLWQLFTFESKLPVSFYITRANDAFVIGTITDYYNADEQFYYVAGFSISYPQGRKQISTSFYHNPDGDTQPWLIDQQPANVFGSWMGEPSVIPYPSPWGPPPTPRLPAEYQEVEWLKKVSTKAWLWAGKFNPSYMSVECYCCFGGSNTIYAVGASYTNMELILRCYSSKATISYKDISGTAQRVYLTSLRVGLKSYYKCIPNPNGFDITSDFGDISVTLQGWNTNVPLGALRLFGTDGQTSNFTLWEIKVRNIQDDSLIYDLVPCYRKSDNIAGFYDLVTSQFVTYNTAVGDFVIGPNVII